MNREIAMKWAADLRTPGLQQVKGKLFNGEGYCCLGRLCVVLGVEPVNKREVLPVEAVFRAKMYSDHGALREEIDIEIAGMETETLATANDAGVTFAQIADWIEANWERV